MSAPRLLVSVRSVAEAEAAIEGGCDVLDIKEPRRGALGMADPGPIAAIVRRVAEICPSVSMSVALGEIAEWHAQRVVPVLAPSVAWLKLGTAGLGNDREWGAQMATTFGRFSRRADVRSGGETTDDTSNRQARWIAVGYGDCELARGPWPEEVLAQAALRGCAGVLFDTHSKGNHRLVDCLSIDRLERLAALARSQGLLFALAGKLQIGDIATLRPVQPDIIGIRSAACRGGIRMGPIDADAVRAFREALS